MVRLIFFLVRARLKLKKHEPFQFTNQKAYNDFYFFGSNKFWKVEYDEAGVPTTMPAHVSLNWLLDPDCKIRKVFK